jgi:Flp pilus assembly protein TadD
MVRKTMIQAMTRYCLPACALLALGLGVMQPVAVAGGKKSTEETRRKYNEEIRKNYNYRFGKNPWLPSQTQNESGEFIPGSDFPKASYCAKCHEEAHRQWRESAHSNAFRNPFYKRNVDILNNTKGIEFSRHCEGCHNPIALFSGALSKGVKVDRWFDDEGVTCMTCHSIARIQNTSGIGSYVMGQPAVMVDEQGKPVAGLPTYDEILAHPKRHAQAVMKDIYKTPEFCATCHKAAVPRQLNEYKWLRAFSVYDEWQQSSWSRESPLPFYKKDEAKVCQTCHMEAEPLVRADYGAKEGKLKSHRWLGAHTAVPVLYKFDEQLRRVIAFLQNDLLHVDLFALSKGDAEELIAPIDRSDFTLAPGETITLAAYIQNKGIGHSLVPEQRDFYESWVEFKVTDAAGNVVAHSGFIRPDGYLDPDAHSYTNWIVGKDNRFLDLHQVWLTRIRAYDQTILPGASDLVRYRFVIPANARGPLQVMMRVNYRRFRQGWMEYALQKKGPMPEYPTVTMATKEMTLALGENYGTPAASPAQEMLRWNNFGIALLLQQQYARAVPMFEKVVALDPRYAPGYTNIALAYFSYEKYDEALPYLEKTLALEPDNARALFYKASILRIKGRLDEAAQLLQPVMQRYPRFRQGHALLGSIYYQQKKYQMARKSYESLQGIDPDDLAAHYNLMILYRRLGLKDKEAEQAAYYADRKEDRAAEDFAHQFLRSNPYVSTESVPWHVHVERPMLAAGGGDD